MRLSSLCAALVASVVVVADAVAEELQFVDGQVWTEIRILERGPGYLLVMHEREMHTIWGAALTEECTTRLKLERLSAPDPEKEAAEAAERLAKHRAQENERQRQAMAAEEQQRRDRKMRELQSQARSLSRGARCYLVGVVIQRLDDGALVLARDVGYVEIGPKPPPDLWKPAGQQERPAPTLPCVKGLIFVREGPALLGKYKDATVSGIVYPVGEYSYTDVQNAPQRVAAWTFSPP